MVLPWRGRVLQERPTTERQSYLPELIIRIRIIGKPLGIIRSHMCLPNTPGHCILKVMNRDGDPVGPFLTLKIKFTVIKIREL
jgi:hypothetical protein